MAYRKFNTSYIDRILPLVQPGKEFVLVRPCIRPHIQDTVKKLDSIKYISKNWLPAWYVKSVKIIQNEYRSGFSLMGKFISPRLTVPETSSLFSPSPDFPDSQSYCINVFEPEDTLILQESPYIAMLGLYQYALNLIRQTEVTTPILNGFLKSLPFMNLMNGLKVYELAKSSFSQRTWSIVGIRKPLITIGRNRKLKTIDMFGREILPDGRPGLKLFFLSPISDILMLGRINTWTTSVHFKISAGLERRNVWIRQIEKILKEELKIS
jgi:hypothetical protein